MYRRYLKARAVVKALRAAGHQAFFVGGWVRDYVRAGRMVRRVSGDIDIATSAQPRDVLALYPRSLGIGERFGVMVVPAEAGDSFEVSTFRKEGAYRDGRHPEQVSFTDAETDARRRDFTVNGLFFDPINHQVTDYIGGLDDIEAGLIRAIGDPRERFGEDSLRLIRAVRLAVQLGFRIEPQTRAALEALAPGIGRISPERVRDELSRLLEGPDPAGGIELLHRTGLLGQVIPEVAALAAVPQSEDYHPEGDALVHTLGTLRAVERPPAEGRLELMLGALLHDVGKGPTMTADGERVRFPEHDRVGAEMAREILSRLRFPNRVIDQVISLVGEHMRFKDFERMRRSTQIRFLSRPDFPLHLELHRADCLASHGDLRIHRLASGMRRELESAPPPVEPLIRGRDLLRMGYPPGPLFGRVLKEVEDSRLEGTILTAAAAREYVREKLGPPVGEPRAKKERERRPS